jgi:hypothetical protein
MSFWSYRRTLGDLLLAQESNGSSAYRSSLFLSVWRILSNARGRYSTNIPHVQTTAGSCRDEKCAAGALPARLHVLLAFGLADSNMSSATAPPSHFSLCPSHATLSKVLIVAREYHHLFAYHIESCNIQTLMVSGDCRSLAHLQIQMSNHPRLT